MKRIFTTVFFSFGLASTLWANPMPNDEFWVGSTDKQEVEAQYMKYERYDDGSEFGSYTATDYPVYPLLRAEVEVTDMGDDWYPWDDEYIVKRVWKLDKDDPLLIDGDYSIDPCVRPGTYVYLFYSYDLFGEIHFTVESNWHIVTINDHGIDCPSSGRELDMTTEEFRALEGISPDTDVMLKYKTDSGGCSLTVI